MLPTNKAQFLRQALSLKLTMVQHTWMPGGKLIGVKRGVERVQTTGIQFDGGSFLELEKASHLSFNEERLTVDLNRDGKFTAVMVYVMEEV